MPDFTFLLILLLELFSKRCGLIQNTKEEDLNDRDQKSK